MLPAPLLAVGAALHQRVAAPPWRHLQRRRELAGARNVPNFGCWCRARFGLQTCQCLWMRRLRRRRTKAIAPRVATRSSNVHTEEVGSRRVHRQSGSHGPGIRTYPCAGGGPPGAACPHSPLAPCHAPFPRDGSPYSTHPTAPARSWTQRSHPAAPECACTQRGYRSLPYKRPPRWGPPPTPAHPPPTALHCARLGEGGGGGRWRRPTQSGPTLRPAPPAYTPRVAADSAGRRFKGCVTMDVTGRDRAALGGRQSGSAPVLLAGFGCTHPLAIHTKATHTRACAHTRARTYHTHHTNP